MFRSVIMFIVLIVNVVLCSDLKVTTCYRSTFDITGGKIDNREDTTVFTFKTNGRFVHEAGDLVSIYLYTEEMKTFTLKGSSISVVPCRSEVGNEYLYIFDLPNRRIMAYSQLGFMTEFDIMTIDGGDN